MMSSASAAAATAATAGSDLAEALQRVEKERDGAWEWWTREQERSSQLCAQNDVLMREIRHLRGQLGERRAHEVVVHAESMSDSDDDSFCKVSLKSFDELSAINGGNPIGASMMDAAPSQTSFGASVVSGARPLASLDRVLSKGRVLHRNLNAKSFAAAARDSTDSFGASPTRQSPPGAADRRAARAKRVVSKVFHNLTPGNVKRRGDPSRPYMAGRFATTDTAVGNYAKEIFEFDDGRARGNTLESIDSADPQQSRVRSIVYSGPMIKHATGGVSVTFTSQEVHDLQLRTDAIPEEGLDEAAAAECEQGADTAAPARRSSSSLGAKRTRAMVQKTPAAAAAAAGSDTEMADGPIESEYDGDSAAAEDEGDSDGYVSEGSADELPTPPAGRSAAVSSSMLADEMPPPGLIGISSAASLQSTVKKRRRLHGARMVVDVESPDNHLAAQASAAPRLSLHMAGGEAPGAWASSPALAALEPAGAQARVARAAMPQESKQQVLFTPVRTRSRNHLDETSPTTDARDKQESIFTTPMKMLSRLRNRKK
ncbi:hypothetical protein H4R19_002610 [Coemansia spiralis]|nr:hypothetical protein H4R19_002610 [Coemansia spiralis]